MGYKIKHPIRCLLNSGGALLSIGGVTFLMCRAIQKGSLWHVVSFAVYGISLIALFTMSALYHSLNVMPRTTNILRRVDHAMIYLLIAGTYTPVCLVVLRGAWGWSLFGIVWGLAILGIVLKLSLGNPPRPLVYMLFSFFMIMGWVVVFAWLPLTRALDPAALGWLLAGGIFYTVGAMILNIKCLNFVPGFGAHEIWHLFVVAGSFSHFWLMFRYILNMT